MLSIPSGPNRDHLNLLYRALGEGMARCQYIESCLYLAALGAMKGDHEACSAEFYKKTGMGGRLKFTDSRVRVALPLEVCDRVWEPLRADADSIVKFRNQLAHFEVYHLSESERAEVSTATAYSVIIAGSHMNAATRKQVATPTQTIEMILHNNGQLMETVYALMYFVIDYFPSDAFVGKGLLPLVEGRLAEFRRDPRPSQFQRL